MDITNSEVVPTPPEGQRQEAFELLAQIVRENHESKRRSFGASLKPEMRRRTFDGFDEKRVGFDSFRGFLVAAAEVGVVDVHRAVRGPDVVLAPPGEEPYDPTPGPADRDEPRRRLRADLWECFVDWDDRFRRVYDRERDAAVRFPTTPSSLEPLDRAEFRQIVSKEADRFVPIEPIPFAQQLDWMRDFVEGLRDPAPRQRLKLAFASSKPFRAFTQALNGEGELRGRWIVHRQSLVERTIREWMTGHELEFEVYESAGEASSPPPPSARTEATSEDERLQRMRDQLKRAIDRMPAAELEALKIPYGYILDA